MIPLLKWLLLNYVHVASSVFVKDAYYYKLNKGMSACKQNLFEILSDILNLIFHPVRNIFTSL
jgi:hypothetical protein